MICPYCGIAFIEDFCTKELVTNSTIRFKENELKHTSIAYEICPNCQQLIIALGVGFDTLGNNPYNFTLANPSYTLVYPMLTYRKPVPKEVNDIHIKEDYEEACLVLPYSPKASAALSRRCLQSLLKKKGKTTKFNLADAIDEAKESLPSAISTSLHLLREMGNFAAHEQKDKSTGEIIGINDGEAEFMLEIQ